MVGEKILHYHIQARIGDGGMGVLYRAHDTRLDRTVALKFLHVRASDAEQKRRLLREARASSALAHPNICTIHDVAETLDGSVFIVMHHIEGVPLTQRIADGPMPIDEAVEIAMQVASGLASAHARKIIHRDIKPSNIMLGQDGLVKIIDFGVARQLDATAEDNRVIRGTIAYMSPEQARGEEVDARTDIWALGVVLYEMLTGRVPFRADLPMALIYLILDETAVPVNEVRTEIPAALSQVVARAMEKDRARRFQSMEEFTAALRAAVDGAPVAHRTGHASAAATIEGARAAAARYDWREAYDTYLALDARGSLATDNLLDYAQAALWVNEPAVMRDAWARAHAAYVKEGRTADAALTAILIGEEYHDRGQVAVANGWVRRAEGLLHGAPLSLAHGYMARVRTRIALESQRDLDTADRFAAETFEIAERFGDADLRALALQDRGRILVQRHCIAKGMSLLDEAMVAAVAGELSPLAVGKAYCNVISTCERVGDYRRAGEWSNHAERWCSPLRESPFPGICSVHRAEVMQARGAWTDAEEQAEKAVASHVQWEHGVAAQAQYVVGMIRLLRHQLDAAEQAFHRAHELGRAPVPGLALLRLRQGRVDAARVLIDGALAEGSTHPLDRVRQLPAAVAITIAAKDLKAAESHARELEKIAMSLESPMFRAQSESAWGAIALEHGRLDEAFMRLRQALSHFRQAEMPYDEAVTRLMLAQAYRQSGDADHARLEAGTARTILERLGARGDTATAEGLLTDLESTRNA